MLKEKKSEQQIAGLVVKIGHSCCCLSWALISWKVDYD
jgi:hypothetical protein